MKKCSFKGCKKIIYDVSTHCNSCCKKGRKLSDEAKEKIRNAKLGDRNPMWRGDKVGYEALHEWIKNRLPKIKLCQECKKKPPYDLANISQKYKRDLSDWEWLCRRCHMIKDGRLKTLYHKKMLSIKRKEMICPECHKKINPVYHSVLNNYEIVCPLCDELIMDE